MEFKVVEVPNVHTNGAASELVTALVENVGKALELPYEDRDPNTIRKGIRSSLSIRGMLDKYHFRTRVFPERKVMTVWLEAKPPLPSERTVQAQLNRESVAKEK
jgi:hypothetical protein